MPINYYILEKRSLKYFSSKTFSFLIAYKVIHLCCRNAFKNHGGGNPIRPLRQWELQRIAGGSDDFKCGLKDIFRDDALYLHAGVRTYVYERASSDLRVCDSLDIPRSFLCGSPGNVRACVLAPHAALWNPAYGMQCETQSRDFIFDHRPATFVDLCGA